MTLSLLSGELNSQLLSQTTSTALIGGPAVKVFGNSDPKANLKALSIAVSQSNFVNPPVVGNLIFSVVFKLHCGKSFKRRYSVTPQQYLQTETFLNKNIRSIQVSVISDSPEDTLKPTAIILSNIVFESFSAKRCFN